MCKNFALIYKCEDPHLHTPHDKRTLGVTMLSNSFVSEQTKLKSSMHKIMKTHTRYQRITPEILEEYKVMNPSLLCDSSSQDSVESPPKNDSKILTSNKHKRDFHDTPKQQVPNAYPWDY